MGMGVGVGWLMVGDAEEYGWWEKVSRGDRFKGLFKGMR